MKTWRHNLATFLFIVVLIICAICLSCRVEAKDLVFKDSVITEVKSNPGWNSYRIFGCEFDDDDRIVAEVQIRLIVPENVVIGQVDDKFSVNLFAASEKEKGE